MDINNYEPWEFFYSSLHRLPEWLKTPVPFVVNVVPLFKEFSVKLVLDLGCGIGRHCIYLAKRGFNITGIDTSRRALMIANSWSQTEEFETRLLSASMTDLPFINKSFQAIISISVIHHAIRRDIEKTVGVR